ncbi:MAG: hypothetical protein IPF99_35255 [Deltaproteobacteria bacterium]|nr:hypothetical protein [Deltaproteobacteria bacterium]
MTAWSLITAMNRIRPPQPVHVSASNPQTRFSSVAQSHFVSAICCTAATPAAPPAHVEVAVDGVAVGDHDAVVG